MTIADKLARINGIKQEIKQAIEGRGEHVGNSPFSHYPDLVRAIESGGELPVGTVADYKLNQNADGWLPCDGSLVRIDEFPDLHKVLPESPVKITGRVNGIPAVPEEYMLNALAFSEEGSYLYAGYFRQSEDGMSSIFRVIDSSSWSVDQELSLDGAIISLAVIAGGTQILATCLYILNGSEFITESVYINTADWTVDKIISWDEPLNAQSIKYIESLDAIIYTDISPPYLKGRRVSDMSRLNFDLSLDNINAVSWTYIPTINVIALNGILEGEQTMLVHLFSLPNFEYLGSVPGIQGIAHNMENSPDGRFLAIRIGIGAGETCIIETSTFTVVHRINYTSIPLFTPSSKQLLCLPSGAGRDKVLVSLTDFSESELIFDDEVGILSNPTFKPSGTHIAGSKDNNLVVLSTSQPSPGYFSLPKLEPVIYGNVKVQPMIKAEV